MNRGNADVIWIVQRVVTADYEGPITRVVSWHRTLAKAKEMAARLQSEFDRACAYVWPKYEGVETIYTMLEEREHHQGDPSEHVATMLEQLSQWWHQELHSWQTFVEEEVMAKMSDPPNWCQDLVRYDTGVSYECQAVSHDPAVTRAAYNARTTAPRDEGSP